MGGFFLGYLFFAPGGVLQLEQDPFSDSKLAIFNVRFEEDKSTEGQVELSFQAARQFRVRGSLEDNRIQRLLAYALINEQNAGIRLRAASEIQRGGGPSEPLLGSEIQAALIGALKIDPNPAVRYQAMEALGKYSMSPALEDALLDVLRYDENARLRIEAINFLAELYKSNSQLSDDILDVLEQKAANDNNDFIRDRARSILVGAGHRF
jgi:HEAT repeat protein